MFFLNVFFFFSIFGFSLVVFFVYMQILNDFERLING